MLSSSAFVRYTIGLLLAGTLALLGIVVAASWLSNLASEDAAEIATLREARTRASLVLASLLDVETAQRGYLLTGTESYLAPYDTARPRLAADLDRLRTLLANDAALARDAQRLSEVIQVKLAGLASTIELAKAGQRDEALAIVRTDAGRIQMVEAREILDRLIATTEKLVVEKVDEVTDGVGVLRIVTLAGSVLIVLFTGGAAFTVIRHTRGLVLAQREIATLNEGLEERVEERTAALTRANDEIQRFAYIVSHDLRSPLVNVMGFTSEMEGSMEPLRKFIESEQPGDAERTEALQVVGEDIPEALNFIRASTTKMDRLINAILKLSREGRRELNPEPVDLVKLLGQAAGSVQHQIDEIGAGIELPDKAPVIVGDRLALEQVVGNLLDNAVKYLTPGRIGRISLNAAQRGNRVHIEVADNGRGVAAHDQERIFELFRRAGTQDKPGEGIGLAHVRALVRRMGGDITVSSELGSGSTFRIDLPARFRPTDR